MPARSHLKKKDLDQLRKMLQLERQSILQHLTEVENDSNNELNNISGDSADIANIEITQASLNKLGGREKKLLKKIDHALAKFEAGEYGICEHTGDPIPLERLIARPVAQYTVEAKMELERQERRYRDSSEAEDDGADFDDIE